MARAKDAYNLNFFMGNDPHELVEKFGSPLYVYNENILIQRCREMAKLVSYPNFKVNYSAKANSNLYLLKTIRREGLCVDAISPAEIYLEELAGFTPDKIFFVCNNVSADEMKYAIDHDILISVDSLSQLNQFGMINEGGEVAVRFNPGIGAGHHEKVVTGGGKTKFGISPEYIPDVKSIIERYKLRLVGINQHIGSLFMDDSHYIGAFKSITEIARQFDNLEFIDLGGGFGIPYNKNGNEARLDLHSLGVKLDGLIQDFVKDYGISPVFKIEPGRYIASECGVLLGTVHAVKHNGHDKYIGTDIGFNVLIRPAMYGAHHDIDVYKTSGIHTGVTEPVTVVGNICENGDIISKNRVLPEIEEGDVLGVLDAGAYGYSMSCNYNNRLRPAEVFIKENGDVILTRRRDTIEDIVRNFDGLYK